MIACPPNIDSSVFGALLKAAERAPSPDNNQPWAFRAGHDSIDVFHRRDRALPSDARDMFSWIALGAAVENIVLAASAYSLAAEVEYQPRPFTTSELGEHIATVRLATGSEPDPLHPFIESRVTNRRLYARNAVPAAELQRVSSAVDDRREKVTWITEPAQLRSLARLVALVDRIRFEHRPFHEEFHKVLRYDEDDARRRGDGLSLKSLELPSLAGPLMRWLRPWTRMRLANRLGMSRVFAGYSVRQVRRSGAVGLLLTAEATDRGYLQAGRSLQRVWLAATERQLAFQPLGGLPLFLTKLAAEGPAAFLPSHAAALSGVADGFCQLFPEARIHAPVMLFRVGRAPGPSTRSYRIRVAAPADTVPSF